MERAAYAEGEAGRDPDGRYRRSGGTADLGIDGGEDDIEGKVDSTEGEVVVVDGEVEWERSKGRPGTIGEAVS